MPIPSSGTLEVRVLMDLAMDLKVPRASVLYMNTTCSGLDRSSPYPISLTQHDKRFFGYDDQQFCSLHPGRNH